MILVTVGAQMPFDRLIRAVDEWAGKRGRTDLLAQVGPGGWKPQHIPWVEFLSPADFRSHVERATAIVSHAGMGSILTALEAGKPIVVMPRRGDLRETRNDHQLATAKQLLAQGRVLVAFDETQIDDRLDQLSEYTKNTRLQSHASPELISALQQFFWQDIHKEHQR